MQRLTHLDKAEDARLKRRHAILHLRQQLVLKTTRSSAETLGSTSPQIKFGKHDPLWRMENMNLKRMEMLSFPPPTPQQSNICCATCCIKPLKCDSLVGRRTTKVLISVDPTLASRHHLIIACEGQLGEAFALELIERVVLVGGRGAKKTAVTCTGRFVGQSSAAQRQCSWTVSMV